MPTNIPLPTYSHIGAPATGYTGWPNLVAPVDYRVWRGWWDYEFARTAAGLVVACCPSAQNADYGELQVWQYDGEYPPNATTSVTLETEKVYACSLLARRDGKLDLWYLKTGAPFQPHHRYSRDGGLTWSSAEVHSTGVFDFFSGDNAYPANTATQIGRRCLPACIQVGTGLTCMLMDGSHDDGGGGVYRGCYWLVAKLASDGLRWEFTGKKLLRGQGSGGVSPTGSASTVGLGGVSQLQPLRDGSVMSLPGFVKFTKIESSAEVKMTAPTVGGTGNGFNRPTTWPYIGSRLAAGWIRESDGAYLWVGSANLIHHSLGSPRPGLKWHGFAGWQQRRVSTLPEWEPNDFYPPDVTITAGGTQVNYDLSFRLGLTNSLTPNIEQVDYEYWGAVDQIRMVKARRDGVFECIRANALGELQFTYARVMPWSNVCLWEGA